MRPMWKTANSGGNTSPCGKIERVKLAQMFEILLIAYCLLLIVLSSKQ